MSRIICISNRISLPDPQTGEIKAGGLAVGVKAALEAYGGGLWFGWDGTVSKTGQAKRTVNTTIHGNITFLTIPLKTAEYENYYKSMANENLWPLMHELGSHIEGHANSYKTYKRVNKSFARLIRPYLKPGDIIWVHDYHLIPLGKELRALGVKNRIGYFNHTPVPSRRFIDSAAVPGFLKRQYKHLLGDLFYYNQVGFQSFRDLRNFKTCISSDIDNPERYQTAPLAYKNKKTQFGVFPISIETADLVRGAKYNGAEYTALRRDKEHYKVLIGAERLDYTKGLTNRLEGVYRFLKRYPQYRRKIKYHQITPLSRQDIKQYKQTIEKTRMAAAKITGAFTEKDWAPLVYKEDFVPRNKLMDGFRHSHIGLVTPLIDGQNLVAKEYLAVQNPRDPGTLILSKKAGAAEELSELGILCVDPRNSSEIAQAINRTLQIPRTDRIKHHRDILSHLYEYDIEHWAERFIQTLMKSGQSAKEPGRKTAFKPVESRSV